MQARCGFTCERRSGLGSRKRSRCSRASKNEIRNVVPPSDLDTMLDNIGLPNSSINTSQDDSGTIGPADGEILISLKEDRRTSTKEYERLLRRVLNQKFPEETFYFQAANITNQILNFGIPMPIDVQIIGQDPKNYGVAVNLAAQIAKIPGAVDVHVHQRIGAPEVWVNVDRSKATQNGIDAAGCGEQPTDLAQRQRRPRADGMAEFPKWSELRHRRANATIPDLNVDDLTRTPIAALTRRQ